MKGTRKRERKVFLAILLVSAVLFAGTGLFTKNVRAETEAKADETGTDDSEMTVNVPETDGKEDGSGYKVIYDTVFFGEYPQSEVLTNEMIGKEPQAEDGSMYGASEVVVDDELYSKLSAAGYDGAGDTVLEGARYRRVASASDSSEVAWRYFRYDPIRWRVLGVHSIEYTDRIAECALLLSDQALDVLPFDEDGAGIWEDSSLRKWLNGSFINMAFTEDEYWNDIAVVEEEASDGSFETYDSDTDITDDVFLLSGSDLFGESAQEYGFIQSKDNTFLGAGEDIARYARATRYALATELNDRGSEQDDKDSALVSWWSRSSVSDTEAGIVDYIGEGGYAAKDMTGIGIRPTLWLDLENASEDYVYAGMLVITPERCEIVDPEDESGEEDIKEKEEQEKKEEPEKKEETEKPEEPEKQEQTEKQEEPKEPEKQEPDKENVGIEKTGKYSDGMLYMSAEWFINRLDVEDFDDRVTERIEVVDMEENLPGKWLVFGQTDYDNPANESYDPETQESYYPLFAQHMKADVTAIGSGYSMTVDSYEMLDCDTGEISVDGVIETLTAGAIEKSTDETEEKIEFEGSANIEISRIFKLDDRLYAAGRITYTSGESVLICMVRETGSNVAADTDRKEEDKTREDNEVKEEKAASRPENPEGERDGSEEMEGLHPYLMQSMSYDDGVFDPSCICEAVHVRFDEKAGVMEIYEYGLFDEPDIILPWDKELKVPKGEYDDGDYHIIADMSATADGVFAGVAEMPDLELAGYIRFDPLIPLEKGQWKYAPDFEGFQWTDVAKFEEIKDENLDERFDPENADNEEIWLVNTTGEITLWDWAVYMEGYSRINDLFIKEAQKFADENSYSMDGWKPDKNKIK